MECSYCGATYDEQYEGYVLCKEDSPSEEGEPICEDCYDEHFATPCALCKETFPSYQRKYIVVTRPDVDVIMNHKLRAGYHLILRYPFLWGSMLGWEGFMHDRLQFVGKPHPNHVAYHNGHICPHCAKKVGIYKSNHPTP